MHKDNNTTRRKVLFVVPPKVHLLDINGPAHIFYEAKEYGADVDLHFVTPTIENKVTSSAGLIFSDLIHFSEFQLTDRDFIFVPGIYFSLLQNSHFIKNCTPFFEWLSIQNNKRVHICSVCTGTFLLGESGILERRSCTTHWKRLETFKKRYPKIDVKDNRLFVIDDNVYTSAGISSGIDLALYILEEKFGSKIAVDVAKEAVIYFRRGEFDPQLSIYLQYRNHLEERIHNAQEFIIQNIHRSFNISDIAEEVHMSSRNLTRLFKKTTGITIHLYTEKLRVEKALNLLSEKNKIELIADECGFKSVSQLRVVLNKYRKHLPDF
ncbi:GlxA family transcriptional regulator [Aquimarina algiphila]|uniref:AraC family transcriptional regulator n=1 Tax=Aquimarina algiphila TaxID=2047982 RepID=A0A554VDS6_9FLAO|nr:DJ-1/PfpI family protein [Aquimarina algiphila]TSE05042.1 AraC family transcriptional regulator [Aquimarina algiphila]